MLIGLKSPAGEVGDNTLDIHLVPKRQAEGTASTPERVTELRNSPLIQKMATRWGFVQIGLEKPDPAATLG